MRRSVKCASEWVSEWLYVRASACLPTIDNYQHMTRAHCVYVSRVCRIIMIICGPSLFANGSVLMCVCALPCMLFRFSILLSIFECTHCIIGTWYFVLYVFFFKYFLYFSFHWVNIFVCITSYKSIFGPEVVFFRFKCFRTELWLWTIPTRIQPRNRNN